jgi:uncharacterized protein
MTNIEDSRLDPPLAEKVAFLRRPEAYPVRTAKVEPVETHMSWVFLIDELVYKLKKPVRYDFLDFSTVEARRRNCERELRLNRRLAEDVYRGVVPLVVQAGGGLRLGGEGTAVDWLVEMRRLPARRMLDAAIRNRTVDAADIRRLSRLLIDFYGRSPPVAMSAVAYRALFEDGVRLNQAELASPQYGLPAQRIENLAAAQLAFIDTHGGLLDRRAREEKIIDAHGDLRPEHICLTEEPKIIDCLEFNREFRLLDPVDELAYLAMECERLGAAPLGDEILRRYLEASGDAVPEELIWFYKAFRACLRARIAIWHIADHEVRDADKWRGRAGAYLQLAGRYVARC